MSAVLPVNIAGFALIGLALLLFIADIFAPTHGVLTFGGIAAFFLGALMLFDRNDPAFQLPLGYIIPATLLTAAFLRVRGRRRNPGAVSAGQSGAGNDGGKNRASPRSPD